MAGDKKGKGKVVVKPKRKRTREERVLLQFQILRISHRGQFVSVRHRQRLRGSQGHEQHQQGQSQRQLPLRAVCRYAAQGVRVLQQQQLHHHHLTILVLVPVVELLRG
ncbi:hypothetical protein GQ55_8G174600 [Panicum hallii var. hallii]|uniref:Uncharacterized protein n=1 Tax=Panicum hallii var. hallii TaxID=1504633 RepID=A0A2T7CNI8_9POAL|nr:hypothetical protein GQ55_8G174600 [Panicum hallii var. hallii]